jgi:hypothetical protein
MNRPRSLARVAGRLRPIRATSIFAVLLAAGAALAFTTIRSKVVAVSLIATGLLLLLTAVALWDWVASMISRAPYLDWLPRHPLPPWLRPVRSSFIAIAFFYGIVIGHYFWH